MNKFLFEGRLTKRPVLQTSTRTDGSESKYVHFSLIRNEYTGRDEQSGENRPERVVAPYFTIFGNRAEFLAKHIFEGDQLIVEARMTTDVLERNGETTYQTSLIVEDFTQGAPGKRKREFLESKARDSANQHSNDNGY